MSPPLCPQSGQVSLLLSQRLLSRWHLGFHRLKLLLHLLHCPEQLLHLFNRQFLLTLLWVSTIYHNLTTDSRLIQDKGFYFKWILIYTIKCCRVLKKHLNPKNNKNKNKVNYPGSEVVFLFSYFERGFEGISWYCDDTLKRLNIFLNIVASFF